LPSQRARQSRICPISSACNADHPNRPEFCPSYAKAKALSDRVFVFPTDTKGFPETLRYIVRLYPSALNPEARSAVPVVSTWATGMRRKGLDRSWPQRLSDDSTDPRSHPQANTAANGLRPPSAVLRLPRATQGTPAGCLGSNPSAASEVHSTPTGAPRVPSTGPSTSAKAPRSSPRSTAAIQATRSINGIRGKPNASSLMS